MSNNSNKKKISSHWITVSFIICCCYFLDSRTSEWLPDVNSNSLDFSVSSARQHLADLVALGPRVAGTAVNDIQTVQLLKSKLEAIQFLAPDHVKVEIDEQHPSGEMYLGFLNGITNIYKNVSNVVVRISWPEAEAEHTHDSPAVTEQAVLVNAHFDSAPGSPGASDDGIGIAVMLEVTHALVMGRALKKPIVMLFNGAEESNHHAAHGFITRHRWAKSIKYLLNLEAIGAGGREMVFQCNSAELIALYSKAAPFRHGQALAHELFKHILWRAASTDWRTLLQHGSPGMHGLDTAYLKNGYVYHTHFDKEEILPDGTFLNTGANILQLTRALSMSTEDDFDGSEPSLDPGEESVVFFDLLGGWLFVSYRGSWVCVLHVLVLAGGACTVLVLCRPLYAHISTLLLDEVKCVVLPLLANAAFGLVCHVFCPMTWYAGGKGYALVLFVPPAALTAAWIRGTCVASRPYLTDPAARQASALFLWMLLALPVVLSGLVSAYPQCLWVLFSSLAMVMYGQVVGSHSLAVRKMQAHNSSSSSSYSMWSAYHSALQRCDEDVVYMLCLVPCTVMWCSLANILLNMTIPLVGKSGTVVPGDVAVAAVIGTLVTLPAGSLMANHVHSRVNAVTLKAGGLLVVLFLLYTMCFHNVAYSAQRPKRLWLQHVERTIESTERGVATTTHDHGLWVSAFDGQGLEPLKDLHHAQVQTKHHAKAACSVTDGGCFMSFPWYFPVPESVRDNMYIPTQAPPSPRNSKARLQLLLMSTPIPSNPAPPLRQSSGGQGRQEQKSSEGGSRALAWSKQTQREAEEVFRFIDITLVGATHMALVIQDQAAGARVVAWDLQNTQDATSATGDLDSASHTRALLAFRAEDLVEPYAPRAEGIFYLQIGFGLCPGDVCSKVLRLKVRGSAPVRFSAYSHYVSTADWEGDAALQSFHQSLPKWSQNAYFTQFPSMLVSKEI